MPSRRHIQDDQLKLPFGDPERKLPGSVEAAALVALHSAVRLVFDVGEGRVAASAVALEAIDTSLSVLAAHHPGGRLGHVVRRYCAQPTTAARWTEMVEELAFVLSLTPTAGFPKRS